MQRESEFRSFLETIPDACFVHDPDGKLIGVNRRACSRFGYTHEEMLGMTIMDIDSDAAEHVDKQRWRQLDIDESLLFSAQYRHKNGELIPVAVHLAVSLIDGRHLVLGLVRDLADCRPLVGADNRLSKLYKALSEVNQAIVRMDDESVLLPLVCRMAVDFGGLNVAWIGRLNDDCTLIEAAASYGITADDLDVAVAVINNALLAGDGAEAIALRESRSVIMNNIGDGVAPWCGQAALYGRASIGAFPIYRAGRLFAILVVCDAQPDAFDTEIIGLLNEMSGDISFALDNFDRENERKQAAEVLRISEDKFAKTFRNSPNPISITSLADGRIVEVNEAWVRISGYSYDEVIGRTVDDLGIWKNANDRKILAAELVEKGRASDFEFVFKTRTGEAICLVSAEIVEIQNETCLVLVAQDITRLRQAMDTIIEQKNFLNAIFEGEPECVKVVSPYGGLIQMNSAGLAMLEVDSLAEAQASGLLNFIKPEFRKAFSNLHRSVCEGGSGVLEFPITGKRGTQRWLETHATPLRNATGEIIALLGVTRDITQRKQSDQLIWKQANFDLLTDLPNRFMFYDRLEQEIKKARRDDELLALFFIDLDRFKEVNDTLGHQIGDMLLVEAARRIVSCVRKSDTVARLGGDEFTVILAQQRDGNYIDEIARNIIIKLAEPFTLLDAQGQIYISASIGITLYPDDGSDAEQLLRNADQAMYVAKNSGRNRFGYFTGSMQQQAQSRLSLLSDLRGALGANQLMLYFQPIVEMSTGRIVKAEALLRWHHPQRGLVSPMEFIPLAEETGLIVEIGDWVFREAARQASRWYGMFAHPVQLSVNMSPVEFQSESMCMPTRLAYLQELNLPGQSIAIEITEGLLLHVDPGITDKLMQFRNANIQVAIDDFGTGYSALSYLKKFDIDYLKLDQSFVRDLATDASDMALSEAIIVMAHKLGLKVIAEGVETAEQRDLLANAGCDYAQGYLYSRPVAADVFESMLAQREN
ncbi:MAG: EAL domain-containing protein [Sulfuriferula sp.]|nr:EAL domain-containing protein [Sulfuriferula sp.]